MEVIILTSTELCKVLDIVGVIFAKGNDLYEVDNELSRSGCRRGCKREDGWQVYDEDDEWVAVLRYVSNGSYYIAKREA